ncbi:MAG: ABC transporter substrate-binding protein [Acidimicrobiales bacterium]
MNRPLKWRPTVLLATASMVATTTTGIALTTTNASAASTVPTASINVWLVDNGKNVNDYWTAQAKAFDKANPGDTVNIEIQPSSNSYKGKVLAALASSSPPDLFFSWGGGPMLQYINAKTIQPFADPGVADAGNPSWKSDFLASSLGAVTFNNKIYGMPILGTQPVFFFYNRPLMAKYHLSFPKTVPQLLSDVTTLAKHNVTAIALGNADEWEGLMYLEYFTDRIGGPQVFLNIEANKKGAWSNPAVLQALSDIQTLVKDNAFEKGYDTITYTNGFTDALVYRGVAAMQLMGDWDLGGLLSDDPSFVNSGQLGIAPFPSVPGGKGNPADLEGNTTSYIGLAAHISPAATYVSEQFAKWLFTTKAYAKAEVSFGLVPVIAGSAGLLNASPLRQYLVPIYDAVQKAPYFQYSWDQALGPTKATPMLDNLTKVFDLLETPAQFAKIMNAYQ